MRHLKRLEVGALGVRKSAKTQTRGILKQSTVALVSSSGTLVLLGNTSKLRDFFEKFFHLSIGLQKILVTFISLFVFSIKLRSDASGSTKERL